MNIMRTIGRAAVFGAVAVTVTAIPEGVLSAEFYKGKTITMLIGTSPGGGYDTYARLLTRHMGRHIAGKPKIVAKNMTGAGSRRAASYLYNVAAQDGTFLGTMQRDAIFDPLFEGNKSRAKYDPRKFQWLGSANQDPIVAVAWHTSGVKKYQDLFKKELIVGATAPTSILAWMPHMLSNMFGMKFKVIAGYPGGSEVDLAMVRGELQGRVIYSWQGLKTRRKNWLKEKKVNILFQMDLKKSPDLPNVPLVLDFAKNADDRAILSLLFSVNTFGRPYMAGPGVPKARVAVLRGAFNKTVKDKAYLGDAKKSKRLIIPVDASRLEALIKSAYATPPKLLKRITKLRQPKGKVEMRAASFQIVNGKILKIRAKGRRMAIYFKDKGKQVRAKVHGRNSKIRVGGKKADRGAIKVGMTCKITYEGHDSFAKTIVCP
jgi:tripartite-type tricarboxylate transporter receptor subunit TctC